MRTLALTAKTTGDWALAGKVLSGLVRTVPEAAILLRIEAERSSERLKDAITSDSLNLKPNAASTLLGKSGSVPLLNTGQYVEAIRPISMGPMIYAVGIPGSARNDRGTELAELGLWLEYGTRGMPARPHWRREYRIFKQQVALKMSILMQRKISLAGR